VDQGVKATLRSISTIIVIAVAVVAFFISGIRLFGFQVYGVLSGSMEPSYPVGSLVYVKQVDPAELKIRDVITYSLNRNTIVTHRIIEIVPDENNPNTIRYRTKGDANENADNALVSAGSIIGKVAFCIPHLGNVASYIQSPPGLYVAIGFGILLIAAVIITDSAAGTPGKEGQSGEKKNLLANIPGVSPLLMKLGLIKPQPEPQQGQPSSQPANPQPATAGYPVQTGGYPAQPVQMQGYPQPGMQPPPQAAPYPQQGMQPTPQAGSYPQPGMQPPMQRQPYPQQGMQPPMQRQPYPQPGMQPPMQRQLYPQPGMQPPMQRQPYPQQGMQPSPQAGSYPQPGTQRQPYPQQGMQPPVQQPVAQQGMQPPMQRQPMPQQGAQPVPQAGQYRQHQGYPSYPTGDMQQPRRRAQRSQQGMNTPQ